MDNDRTERDYGEYKSSRAEFLGDEIDTFNERIKSNFNLF